MVNNAGRSSKGSALKTAIDDDRQIYEVNVLGTISLTRHVLPNMIKRKQGHIVVTSSLAGKIGKINPLYSAELSFKQLQPGRLFYLLCQRPIYFLLIFMSTTEQ